MARQRPRLAKLSRPRLHAPVARDRLFRLVDELRASPVVWIEGPPGAGKTTTICSYLDAARLPGTWYQVDGADADPATFFYYLTECAGAPRSRKWRLPLFTADHRDDLRGFARRFFRILFQRLPPGAVLVFDNYQEIANDSPVHDILACAVDEVPEGANVFVLSRVAPPKALARALASDAIATLDWDALRLSVEEIQAIADARGGVAPSMLQFLHRESDGWAAGVVLMLERLRRAGTLDAAQRADSPQATFDYFASQIYDSASAEARDVMLKTAPFPTVTAALAEAVTGNSGAGKVLESLYRRRLFVNRRAGEAVSYQYHALFRAFLLHQAATEYTAAERHELLGRAALLLSDHGQEEDAFALYCKAGDWKRATHTLCAVAPRLIGQGRLQTVEAWVNELPESIRNDNAGVAYWMGMALEPARPRDALPWLQKAYEGYAACDDENGRLLSAAGIIDTIYADYSDFTPMRPWVDLLTRLLAAGPRSTSPEVEFRIHLSLVASVHYAPDNAQISASAERLEAFLREPFDINSKVVAAQRLLSYGDSISDPELCRRITALISPLLDERELTPANTAAFLTVCGYHLYIASKTDESLACLDRALAIAQREGLHDEVFRAMVYRGVCLRRAGQLPAAEAALAALETLRKPVRGARASMADILKSLVAYARGDLEQAIEIGMAAQHLVDSSHNVFNAVVYRAVNAGVLILAEKYDVAAKCLEEARSLASGTAIDKLRAYIALNQAHLAHVLGDHIARNDYLREALLLSATEGGRTRLRWFPKAMEVLFPIALREGIEPELVRSMIKLCSLEPPADAEDNWPWPIKVYTLGRFEIWRDCRRVTFDRKAPKKTLALLQALIAFGATAVSEEKLLEALWPDDEGDAAHRAFTQGLHRLRKLLGDNAAIRQSAGKLSLDLKHCWVDSLAFKRLLQTDSGKDVGTQRAVDLYGGPFLKEDDRLGWIIAAREHLRADFVRAVGKLAERKERSHDFEGAIETYRRGIAADELVEPFYQGLMRCYGHLDRRSEAVGAYRRLRQALSVVLGIQPSAATEKIYREL